jgi:DNA-binding Lrp family transcriptional regulator
MGRVGRPTYNEFWKINGAIEELVKKSPNGITFNNLVEKAQQLGISKPTVWRHLQRLENHGNIVHERKLYRTNPLLQYKMKVSEEYPVKVHETDEIVERAGPFAVTGPKVAMWTTITTDKLTGRERKSSVPKFQGEIKWTPQLFRDLISHQFQDLIFQHLLTLYSVFHCPNERAARAIAKLQLETHIESYVDAFSFLWKHRHEIRLSDLDNLEAKYAIHYKSVPNHNSSALA